MIYNKDCGKLVLEQENILGIQIADFDNLDYVQLELKDECRIPRGVISSKGNSIKLLVIKSK